MIGANQQQASGELARLRERATQVWSEGALRLVFESSPDAILLLDEGVFMVSNLMEKRETKRLRRGRDGRDCALAPKAKRSFARVGEGTASRSGAEVAGWFERDHQRTKDREARRESGSQAGVAYRP